MHHAYRHHAARRRPRDHAAAWCVCVCVPKAFRVKQVHERKAHPNRCTSKKEEGGGGDLEGDSPGVCWTTKQLDSGGVGPPRFLRLVLNVPATFPPRVHTANGCPGAWSSARIYQAQRQYLVLGERISKLCQSVNGFCDHYFPTIQHTDKYFFSS